LKSLTAKI